MTDIALCQLVNLCQPFKWVVNCFILEKRNNWGDSKSADADGDFSYHHRVDYSGFQVLVTCYAFRLQ